MGSGFPDWFVREFGCASCLWKLHGLCPEGLSGDEVLPAGFCEEFADFLSSLRGEGSIASLREGLLLYASELVAWQDYSRLQALLAERRVLLESGVGVRSLEAVDSEIALVKLWWSRLSESLVKGLGRVADRQERSRSRGLLSGRVVNVQDLNRLIDGGGGGDGGS